MRILLVILISFLLVGMASAQKYSISGYVKDAASGEELIGANIMVEGANTGATTNSYGFYSLSLPAGKYSIRYSYIGYNDEVTEINLTKNQSRNVSLNSRAYVTEEIVVTGERTDRNIQDSRMSVNKLPVEEVKTIPAFMGEVDVLKTIQLLPGVQSAGDGNSGFYVRGGGPDQNLILLDEAVVYNASHLFGFFSVFNADAIKDVELYKGGMPAQYGGRVSSVLDISMDNGNMRSYHVDGGIGTIATRLTAQGPIIPDTASFLISGRRTYIDILVKPFVRDTSPFKGSGYYFYDFNAKFNYRFSDKDRVFLSGYYGKDVFTFKSTESNFTMKIPWGNGMVSARWNHLFNSRFFLNSTAVFSDYQFSTDVGMKNEDGSDGFRLIQNSGIRDFNFKQDFTWLPNPKHTVKFGLFYVYHIFTPNTVNADFGDMEYNFNGRNRQYAHEAAVYIGDDFIINDIISVYVGFRFAGFFQSGPFTRYIKDQNNLQTIDSVMYGKNALVCDYYSPEPRFSMKISTGKTSSVKLSFMQNNQFIHLASLSASTLPTDLWVPSSDKVKPQFGRQIAAGYFRNFGNNQYEVSAEIYYKQLDNLIEYMDGAMYGDDLNDNPDNYFIFGEGNSYGLELFFKRRTGRLTGWIGYTWSKTERWFDEVDNGNPFPAKYDRRHDVSVTATYSLNERWTFGMVFVYATGNTTTLPIGRYVIDGQIVNEYGPRNSFRLDPYHRLDLSVTYVLKKSGKWTSDLNLSVYNVYNRKNPYFIYFFYEGNVDEGSFRTVARQVSLIPILPALTWNFSF
ncbi:MAG TPA: TonB-dependent receptor [Bacteroidales bacterium]|nr:TonB-dependent receptor [Bacteroidales bacterium]